MKRLSIVLTLGLLILAAPFTYGAAHTRLVRSCPNGVTCAYASGLNGYVLVGNGVDFDYQLFSGVPAGIGIGTSTITGGADQRVLFQDGTVVAENANLTFVKGTGTLHATLMTATTFTGALAGNATTATALAANGANCSAASFPLGVDASGNAESCTTLSSSNAGTATALAANGTNCSAGSFPLGVDASGASESCTALSASNAGTATALAANPTDCSANQYATTIAANGNLTCAQVDYSQLSGSPTIPTDISGLAYVTIGNTSSLSAERAITAGNNVTFTDGGANSTLTIADGTNAVAFTNAITPTQIAANTNDYNPTGLSTAYTLRLSTDASRNLTGISASGAGAVEGRQLVIENVGSNDLVLKNLTTSSAANQFATGGKDLIMKTGSSISLQYDNTATVWRVFSPKVRITGSGSEPSECSDDQIQSVSDGTNNQCVTVPSDATSATNSLDFQVPFYNKKTNAFDGRTVTTDEVFGKWNIYGATQLANTTGTTVTCGGAWNASCTTNIGTSVVVARNNLPLSTHRQGLSYTTKVSSPTSGDFAGIQNQNLNTETQLNPSWSFYIGTSATITSEQIFVGAFANATNPQFTVSSSAFTATTIGAFAMLVYDTGGSFATTWALCVAQDASANNAICTDTGVTVAQSTIYKMRIYTTDAGTTIFADINGTTVSTTSKVPTNTTDLGRSAHISVRTLTSAQRSFNFIGMGWMESTD